MDFWSKISSRQYFFFVVVWLSTTFKKTKKHTYLSKKSIPWFEVADKGGLTLECIYSAPFWYEVIKNKKPKIQVVIVKVFFRSKILRIFSLRFVPRDLDDFDSLVPKGQIISKGFFLAEDSSIKRTKTGRILVKTNSFIRFLGESSARHFFSKLTDLKQLIFFRFLYKIWTH